MILDALLQLSAAQAVAGTAVSTNTIDLSLARDMGRASPVYAVFGVDAAVTAAGAATVNFQIITSAAAALSSPFVLTQTGSIAKTELTAGRRLIALRVAPALLSSTPNGQRYLGVQYSVATGPLTAGAFTCYITDSPPPGSQVYATSRVVA